MTNEQIIAKLQEAVGGNAYGDAIIAEAREVLNQPAHKYAQDMKDRLDERIGVLKAYERIHRNDGQNAKAVAEAEKLVIAEKALAAIEG